MLMGITMQRKLTIQRNLDYRNRGHPDKNLVDLHAYNVRTITIFYHYLMQGLIPYSYPRPETA